MSETFPLVEGYILHKRIYHGSRIQVYRASAQSCPVMIKLLQVHDPTVSELLRFQNHYNIARSLSIPGILKPLSLDRWQKSYALVMEDWGGEVLEAYIHKHPLTWQETVKIALQITDTLDALHQNRVIHQDIKPANLLIHPDTQQITLSDFSLASLLPQESQVISSSAVEGTLAYMAPEQTGRMNQGIDYRTDFYSLGVTLYKLLTGELPFHAENPVDLLDCRMAISPTAPHLVRSQIPSQLSAIVLKLMAKNAEDRYQSALRLKHDLEFCLSQWEKDGTTSKFAQEKKDYRGRVLIPEKLDGRKALIQSILDAFERVANGSPEMLLIKDGSDIGKTSVINEVDQPITSQNGCFIKGKFDSSNRSIPLSAFAQAFRSLIGQLLGESDVLLAQWRSEILHAVGDTGQVLIEIFPELERLIGVQPQVPELSGTAAQHRLFLLLRQFIQVVSSVDHPLVIFLDDLQWADSASLKLIKLLMDPSSITSCLVLGAYRDNEVFPDHPLLVMLDELVQSGALLQSLTFDEHVVHLNPLSEDAPILEDCEKYTPMNFQHQVDLSHAEHHRVLNQKIEAMESYDRAIAVARKHGYLQEEALANELAAEFYLDWGKEKIAALYLQEAYDCYSRWGAIAKIKDLEQRYPDLLKPPVMPAEQCLNPWTTLASITSPEEISPYSSQPIQSISPDFNQSFDFSAILKAAQTLTETIHLDELLQKLSQIIFRVSGCDHLILTLPNPQGVWNVRLLATPDSTTLVTEPLANNVESPVQLIQYIKTTKKLLLGGHQNSDLPVFDSFLQEHCPQSFLCTPLIHQEELTGILYLHSLTTNDLLFDARLTTLNFLFSQIAIAIRNAQLFEDASLKLSIIESSIDGMAILDNGRYIYLNQNHVSLFGYTVHELMGKSWETLYSPEQIEVLKSTAFPILTQTGQWSGEAIATCKDGRTFPEELSLFLRDDGKLICICRDISDRKAAEQSLYESQQLLQLVLDTIPQHVFWKNRQSVYLGCNRAFAYSAGIAVSEQIVGKTDYELPWKPEESDHFIDCDQRIMATKQSELRIIETQRTAQGLETWIETSKVPLLAPTGDVIGILGVYQDITSNKHAEQQLYESQELLRLVLDTVPQLVFWKDQNSVYMGCNQGFADIAGLKAPGDIIGKSDRELPWTTEETDFFLECDRRIMQSGEAELGIIEPILTADGKTTWSETNKSPLRDADGQVIGILGTIQDITPLKEAEQTLKLMNEELEARVSERTAALEASNHALAEAKELADSANQAKSEFLANMSHELRTPLNGVLGYAQILQRTPSLPTQLQDGIQTIYQCGHHLLTLINDVLDISKIEARKLELTPHDVHLPTFIDTVVEMCQISVDNKDLQFVYQGSSYLPEYVQVDEKRLRQILLNLLGNATKFTETGTITFDVNALKIPENRVSLAFRVVDTGIGIQNQDISKLFVAFEQVGDSRSTAEGTGLGLAISQRLVQLMGSTIHVESVPGQGSEFSFDIDLPLSAKALIPKMTTVSSHSIVGYQGDRKSILVVDDYQENSDLICDLLKPLGFQVRVVKSAQACLEEMREQVPDLLIADLVMPGMNGDEMLNIIHQSEMLCQELKVIMSSAKVSKSIQRDILEQGADAFLSKPISVNELFNLIGQLLDLKWCYQVSEETVAPMLTTDSCVSDPLSQEMVLPPKERLDKLLTLAQRGQLRSLRTELQTLGNEDSQYLPFINPLLKLETLFKVKELELVLERYLSH